MCKSVLSYSIYILLLCQFSLTGQSGQQSTYFSWDNYATLPAVGTQQQALGVAGPITGIHNGALVVAGGANFDTPFWESSKEWHTNIWVLPKNSNWKKAGELSHRLAYAAVLSSPLGIISMGGCDEERTYSEVWLFRWDKSTQSITQESLPDLPHALAYGSAILSDNTIYLAGGTQNLSLSSAQKNFWRLDLSKYGTDDFQWEILPSWQGKERAFNITISQHNGQANCIYVLTGRREGSSTGTWEVLKDVHEFNPSFFKTGKNPWRQKTNMPAARMAGTAIPIGQHHLFVVGGADGSLYQQSNELKENHPGFPKEILGYNSITDTWFSAGSSPMNQVTTTAISDGDSFLLPTGEIKPRVRTPTIWKLTPIRTAIQFGNWDKAALGIYLFFLLGIGGYFSLYNQSTEDFFRGGQTIPWWAAGCSIFATMLSSITFMAIPAKTYATNWVYFLLNMAIIALAPFIIYYILPYFRRINATSAYEYLEQRFNLATRLFASASYILFQVGRMAIVLFLPALALSTVLPITVERSILIMGGMSILYCTLGGIKAVIWTDTLQTVVLLGGALLSFMIILSQPSIGWHNFQSIANESNKFQMIDWDWSYTGTGLWVIILGGIGQTLIPYSSDQGVVQRYMSVESEQQAAKSIWTNAVLSFFATLIFFALGTALFVFYKQLPTAIDPTFQTDAIFPLFIARQLPQGIAGLVIAGIFAAAQSTVSTSMNSIATAITTDFVKRFQLLSTDRNYLRLARLLTILFGIIGTGTALLLAQYDVKSLWDSFLGILGLFGGVVCGLFLLGMFSKKANGKGAFTGALFGAGFLWWVQNYSDLSFLLYATVGIVATIIFGWLASFLFVDSDSVNNFKS